MIEGNCVYANVYTVLHELAGAECAAAADEIKTVVLIVTILVNASAQ